MVTSSSFTDVKLVSRQKEEFLKNGEVTRKVEIIKMKRCWKCGEPAFFVTKADLDYAGGRFISCDICGTSIYPETYISPKVNVNA